MCFIDRRLLSLFNVLKTARKSSLSEVITHDYVFFFQLGHARLVPWMADFSQALLVQLVGRKKKKRKEGEKEKKICDA